MRDPERIARILTKIQVLWGRSPDLRLGQLLANTKDSVAEQKDCPMFYFEDDELESALDSLLTGVNIELEIAQANLATTHGQITARRAAEEVERG